MLLLVVAVVVASIASLVVTANSPFEIVGVDVDPAPMVVAAAAVKERA